MIRLFLLLLCPLAAQTQAEFDAHIWHFEGYRSHVYYVDGKPHIGFGHLIQDNPSDYQPLSRAELLSIYQVDFAQAYRAALIEVSNYEDHPKEVRVLIVALAYNLGQKGLHDFKRFREALAKCDYLTAARELRSSKWARQVGRERRDFYHLVLTRAAMRIE